ncbi:NADPH-dependent ferric siderophore reductase [Chryseobacterium lactis]|uniref:NADPH-dependent ferric siderophore reductase n=1 Tax=Chryseobacterium lactis TaxID=1241981 RepID=A0A3G6RKS6_CHRLC|nr:siderophore-interacting protein [Chryseobacterium lactis]AZA83172.1 siderophore-interacting protein [Chryseobacterium lactis]AZB03557.1 siderophore-interacting protein [Chryseobacterium lactis]PNW11937.1 NADPH-dependent ferric siderophore reductase [Chryseobacterium lactis]
MKNFKAIETELTVTRKEYITPHYIRIFLTGDQVPSIANTTVGVNNKILIPPKGVNAIHFPEFDYDKMVWKPQPEETRPSIRTYTHRGIDLEQNEIWIDFVAHGDEGPASAWAIESKVGDLLGVLMKDGKTELYGKADNYLLVADATGIPVLAAILEDLPATAKGICIIEVHGKEDEQDLQTLADFDFIWLHNQHPQEGSKLSEVVKQQILPEESRSGYVAAEFSSVKEIRSYLRKEKQWKQEELYAYSYWKSGVAEDKSAADRHKENAEIGAE